MCECVCSCCQDGKACLLGLLYPWRTIVTRAGMPQQEARESVHDKGSIAHGGRLDSRRSSGFSQ